MELHEKLNLVPAIHEIETRIHLLEVDFEEQIKPYRESLSTLRKINEACERCNGKGKVLRGRACAEDDAPNPNDPRDWNTCPVCNGSGMSTYKGDMP